MGRALSRYFEELVTQFGNGWNRFWYTPSDPLPLGLLRILTGLVACYFQVTYVWDLVRLFGPQGMLPVDVVRQFSGPQVSFSYLSYLQTPSELWTAHLVGTVILILLTVGLWSRVTSILALVVTLSYVHRAPMLTGTFEPVLTMLLFYLCIGPAGRALSVDQWLRHRKGHDEEKPTDGAARDGQRYFSANIAIRLIQIHVCVIYLMMGISKLAEPGETWWLGDAVWWLIAMPESRLVDLTWLAGHPYVIIAWSHLILMLELIFPVLIWNRLARPPLLTLATMLWVSLALITGMVPFCGTMIIAGVAFIPAVTLRAVLGRHATDKLTAGGETPAVQ
ncbi:MAG: hypothetical protein ACC645_01575 [Pirellulales bacterium]